VKSGNQQLCLGSFYPSKIAFHRFFLKIEVLLAAWYQLSLPLFFGKPPIAFKINGF